MDYRVLLSVGRCGDDETGCYEAGELDFSVPLATGRWLDRPGNRERLSLWLHKLAGMVERSQPPFVGARALSCGSAAATPPGPARDEKRD